MKNYYNKNLIEKRNINIFFFLLTAFFLLTTSLISDAGTISGTFTTLSTCPEELSAMAVDPSSGIFYAVGDQSSSGFYKYNPSTDTWTTLASRSHTTGNNAGATIINGKYYVSYTGKADIDVYDIAANSWSTLSGGPGNTGCIANDGTDIYVLGDTFMKYSLSGGSWTTLTSSSKPESWGGIAFNNGYLYHDQGDSFKAFERYKISTNTWETLTDVPGGAVLGAAIFDAYYYCMGSYNETNLYSYDLGSQTWNNTLTLPWKINDATICVYNNSLYIIQGEAGTGFTKFTPNNPILSGIEGSDISYTVGTSSLNVTSGIVAAQNSGTNFQSATVSITSGFQSGKDVLSFVNANGITGSWNSSTGVLTLSGQSSIANYQAALRSVKYSNTDVSSTSDKRTISFKVSDGTIESNTAARNITLAFPTSLSGSAGATATAPNSAVYIASSALLTGGSLDGAIISINTNFVSGQDVLGIDGVDSGTTTVNGSTISYTYSSSTGILTLTGTASVSTYQTVIRKITYKNTSNTPNTSNRSITISLNSGVPYSGNGHYYEYVTVGGGITWGDAKTAASARTYLGLQGYLVTITSLAESTFCASKLLGQGWLGASDAATEGTWKWVTGPENGTGLTYTNWNSGEPNNSGGDEDCGQFLLDGKWNDLSSTTTLNGYVVEYGGMTGDPVLDISDDVTVYVAAPAASSATNITGKTFKANWGTVSGATAYYLDVATDNAFTNFVAGYNNTNVGNVTTLTVSGLTALTNYYYRVRATSGGFNSSTISLTTTKYDQTISFGALSSKVYGDADFNPSATATSGLAVTYSTSDSNVATVVGGLIHIVGAGTCTVYADQAGNANYFAAGQVSQSLTVNKATLTVTADLKTKIYGDANPALTFQYSGWKNTDGESVLDTKPVASTTVNLLTNVGTYTNVITVSGGVDDNYSFTYVAANFNVTKATLTVTADAKTKIYGDANPALTFQYSGWKNEDGESVLDTKPVASTTVNLLTNVGTYTNVITVSGGVDGNYSFTYVAANFDVTKAPLTVTADSKTKEYGEPNPALTFQYSGWKNQENESVLDEEPSISTDVDLLTGAGTHTGVITLSGGTDNNYKYIFVSGNFIITKAMLILTADSQTKIYGDENPELTFEYSGWKNEDDESDLDIKPVASTSVDLLTSVGTYTDVITISGGVDNNYNFTYIAADFEVTQAVAIIWLDNKIKEYGVEVPALTYRITGLKNHDDESVFDVKFQPYTTVNQYSNVGVYMNSIDVILGSDNNYSFLHVPAHFTVIKGKLSIDVANLPNVTYGDPSFTPNVNTVPGLTFTFASSNENIVSVSSGNILSIKGTGSVTITVSQSGTDNYEASSASVTVTVNKKSLGVDGLVVKTKEYDGTTVAELAGGTLSGVVYSDALTLNIPATGTFSQSTVGNDIPVLTTISVSGDKIGNYIFQAPELKGTIAPKVINVSAKDVTVGCVQTAEELKYTFEPSLIGDDKFTGVLTRTVGDTPGVYPISQGTLTAGSNYSINFKGANYTIVLAANMPPVVDVVADQKAVKNSKQLVVVLTGIDPISGCSPQSVETITATATNVTLVTSVEVEYVKGETTAKLKINIADNQVGDAKITVKIKDNGGVENGGVDTKEISFNLKVEFPTGIDDVNSGIGAKIYPNPSLGPVTVECVGFVEPSIRIFKVTGEEVFKKSKMDGLTQSLDLTGFTAGVYLVEISEDKKVITKKLIIKN
jgi:Lectin C-type domain.